MSNNKYLLYNSKALDW